MFFFIVPLPGYAPASYLTLSHCDSSQRSLYRPCACQQLLDFLATCLRLVSTNSTYWMAGLAHEAAHYFKFLFILALYTLAMTLYVSPSTFLSFILSIEPFSLRLQNFLLGTLFRNGGIAILLSALSALYQMTFAGFFVHLTSIPPVLRWLQWLCPLKYTLEALSVNEVGSGLMIQDTLQGVPVNVSASLIMTLVSISALQIYYVSQLTHTVTHSCLGLASTITIEMFWSYLVTSPPLDSVSLA